jgi:hypothetical protein
MPGTNCDHVELEGKGENQGVKERSVAEQAQRKEFGVDQDQERKDDGHDAEEFLPSVEILGPCGPRSVRRLSEGVDEKDDHTNEEDGRHLHWVE